MFDKPRNYGYGSRVASRDDDDFAYPLVRITTADDAYLVSLHRLYFGSDFLDYLGIESLEGFH